MFAVLIIIKIETMKKTIKESFVVLFMLGTLISYANENETSLPKDDVKKVNLVFTNVKKGHYLSIKDIEGAIIYKEYIKKTGEYSKVFDLTSLENGEYAIELNKDFEIIIKPFKVQTNSIKFLKEKEATIFKPVVRTKKNRIFVSQFSFESEPLTIDIYFEDELISSETLKGKQELNRIYSLSETEKGAYKVIMYSNERAYIETFKI